LQQWRVAILKTTVEEKLVKRDFFWQLTKGNKFWIVAGLTHRDLIKNAVVKFSMSWRQLKRGGYKAVKVYKSDITNSTAKSNFKERGRMMSSEEIEKLADVFSFIALCVWVLTLHIKLDRLNGKLENK